MSEVFITRKGGGAKTSAPELLITEVGGSWIEFEVTNTDQSQPAQVSLLKNYDPNSETEFNILSIQNGKVITVAAGDTVTEFITGLDNQVTHTISAQALVVKKLPSNIVTTDPTDLLQTGLPAPTISSVISSYIGDQNYRFDFLLTNNDTKYAFPVKFAVTTSSSAPSNYPLTTPAIEINTPFSVSATNLAGGQNYYIHARAFDESIESNNTTVGPFFLSVVGQIAYTNPGTYTWIAPTGVTSVSAVAVGGGGGGNNYNGSGGWGGGGGGLGWRNNISVNPGQSYTVVVGSGGSRATNAAAGNGGQSYFLNTATVVGNGGQGGGQNRGSTGGTFVGAGGGNGGAVPSHTTVSDATGGGGAGGYSGNGGAAGNIDNNNAQAGSGGGGGGGGAGGSSDAGGAGGGVGILGQGANGAAGTYNGANGTSGFGGSGGQDGSASTGSAASPSTGGFYGGGGGGAELIDENGPGAGGAVRIIWGTNRSFPATTTGDL
jgi:hypothetical protein